MECKYKYKSSKIQYDDSQFREYLLIFSDSFYFLQISDQCEIIVFFRMLLLSMIFYHFGKKIQGENTETLLRSKANNIEELLHSEHHIEGGKYIKSFIFGGLDGTINVLAVILGGIASGGSPGSILVFGMSLLVGAGLGMGLGDYLSTKAVKQFIQLQEQRQRWQFQHEFDLESAEISKRYVGKGYTQSQAKRLVQLFATSARAFVDIMMLEQLGLVHVQAKPLTNGLVTILAFCTCGLIPMLPYIYGVIIVKDGSSQYLMICLIIAAVILFVLGYAKAAIVRYKPWRSAVETMVLGGVAVGIGYGVGLIFE